MRCYPLEEALCELVKLTWKPAVEPRFTPAVSEKAQGCGTILFHFCGAELIFCKKIYNNVQKGPGIVWKFDYSFLDNGLIPANIVNNTSKIHSSRTETSSRKKEFKAVFTEPESIERVQNWNMRHPSWCKFLHSRSCTGMHGKRMEYQRHWKV